MFIAWMVGVIESNSAGGSKPLREVKHSSAAVSMCDEYVLCRMKEPAASASVDQSIVTRVLREHRWISEITEKPRNSLSGEIGSKALFIARGALAESWVLVCGLIQACIESSGKKRDRIKRILDEEHELIIHL
jgi:hypothetical protein